MDDVKGTDGKALSQGREARSLLGGRIPTTRTISDTDKDCREAKQSKCLMKGR
ncbi:hypothetical protein SCH4B_4117 [Ruegeria sp. TrichCH4B]|nr:hypothetical protein SCH4B_4117 [Ruegeria sp. TrichCH4B]